MPIAWPLLGTQVLGQLTVERLGHVESFKSTTPPGIRKSMSSTPTSSMTTTPRRQSPACKSLRASTRQTTPPHSSNSAEYMTLWDASRPQSTTTDRQSAGLDGEHASRVYDQHNPQRRIGRRSYLDPQNAIPPAAWTTTHGRYFSLWLCSARVGTATALCARRCSLLFRRLTDTEGCSPSTRKICRQIPSSRTCDTDLGHALNRNSTTFRLPGSSLISTSLSF